MNPDRRRILQAAAALPLLTGCGGHDKLPAPGVPRSKFDEDSTAEAVTAGVDLSGRVAVVTGCTSGIGFETMRVLALRGCHVLGSSRSLERATEACRSVDGQTTPLALELADFDSTAACAEQIRSLDAPIDMLILNAGFRGGGNERRIVNGVERHFAVNHLGHFLLANRILDRLHAAEQGRVVTVASRTAYTKAPAAGIAFDDLTLTEDYSDTLAYGHSKLANALFSLGLAMRLRGTTVTSNALHPGVINTDIDRNLNRVTQFAFGLLTAVSGKNAEEGAATSCFVATHPSLATTSGAWFEDCNAITVADGHVHNEAMAEQLWAVSESLLGDYYRAPSAGGSG